MEQKPAKQTIRFASKLPVTAGNLTNLESWESFFTAEGADDFSEWYADWPQAHSLFRKYVSFPALAPRPNELSILVPACGNSRMSEKLYDQGFRNITNVDFSKAVIAAMLRRNVRERPQMKWRVMDMVNIQFANGTFDAIIDKAGLDALLGPRSGILYLSEVKRLLKAGGKFVCFTLAESHELGLLFSKFRFGWRINIYTVAHEGDPETTKQTFMLVAEKSSLTVVSRILPFLDVNFVESQSPQVHELFEALERENIVRVEYSKGTGTWYSLEDLKQGVRRNIREIKPGRLVKLFLGETGVSRFFYTGVLLDAQPETGPFSEKFRVIYFQKTHTSQKILAAEFRQWLILQKFKAARLLIIVLDYSHSNVAWNDLVMDMQHLINQLAPIEIGDEIDIAATSEDDLIESIQQRKLVHQVSSVLSGTIFVEDVIYAISEDVTFRRLCFERTEGLVHSEALLYTEGPNEVENKRAAPRKGKKGNPKKIDPHSSDSHASSSEPKVEVEHRFLTPGFHMGVIAGLLLFSSHSKRTTSAGRLVKTVIVGLGPGILPMFMRTCLPSLQIEVVEIDPVVLEVASKYFDFKEDERLKVHMTDPFMFVREKANSEQVHAKGSESFKVDVLIIDVGSTDPSSGLISPEAEFVEESFLLTAKDSLSDKGVFIFKLVSKYSSVRRSVYSKLRTVFSNLYHFYTDRDFIEVIFALKRDDPIVAEELAESCDALARSLEYNNYDWVKAVLEDARSIEPLPLDDAC